MQEDPTAIPTQEDWESGKMQIGFFCTKPIHNGRIYHEAFKLVKRDGESVPIACEYSPQQVRRFQIISNKDALALYEEDRLPRRMFNAWLVWDSIWSCRYPIKTVANNRTAKHTLEIRKINFL